MYSNLFVFIRQRTYKCIEVGIGGNPWTKSEILGCSTRITVGEIEIGVDIDPNRDPPIAVT